ncbi:MAG: DUF932 domain-containing protein, partial [Candidatus Saccharimonadales bacterium]
MNKDGTANMFYVGETPWHGLGTKLVQAPTAAEAIKAAGLDWKVALKDAFVDGADGKKEMLEDAKLCYRVQDNKQLGTVGHTWKPLQNTEAFSFFDKFLESGEATLETAGSLDGGRKIWILAKLTREPMVIKGNDIVEKYALLCNSHDGTLAARGGFTPIRTVCQNTLQAALESKASKLIRVKHTANIVTNLEKVRDIMNMANAEFETTAENYRLLANTQINQADLTKYVKTVFNTNKEALSVDEMTGGRVAEKIVPLFEKGRGNDMPEIAGTYWAAY